jgi:hypothetical protein
MMAILHNVISLCCKARVLDELWARTGGWTTRNEATNDCMSDRREFLKGAGLLGIASWCGGVSGQSVESAETLQREAGAMQSIEHAENAITLENGELRLVISATGSALSLIHKATGKNALLRTSHCRFSALRRTAPMIMSCNSRFQRKRQASSLSVFATKTASYSLTLRLLDTKRASTSKSPKLILHSVWNG